ncbi:MAG: GNAT family N-acetyltransferase [Candidatus Thiodiazotropha sp. (ex Troendleina suluensis)]|nr:GNAT family N-acetyltransferase [Candidatus Thiodiazotropha sp. (ex Troendleina suluensis)]
MDEWCGSNRGIQITRQPSFLHVLQCFPKMVMRGAQVYLHKSDLNVGWLTVAAEERLSLQGLIVAFIRPQQGVAQIVSWFVVPRYSNQGIGQKMLAALECWCREHRIEDISLELMDENPFYGAASHILHKQGWSDLQPLVHRFKVAVSTLANLQWDRMPRKPSGIKLFPWKSLSNQQLKQLMTRSSNKDHFPAELLLSKRELGIEYAVSFGLCLGEELIGWIIAHRPRHDLIEYSSLYVKSGKRSNGATFLLLGESFQQLIETGATSVIFQVKVDNRPMLRLTRKRFQPFLGQATLFQCKKRLLKDA